MARRRSLKRGFMSVTGPWEEDGRRIIERSMFRMCYLLLARIDGECY